MSHWLTYLMAQLIKKEVSRQLVTGDKRTRKGWQFIMNEKLRKPFEEKFRQIGVHNPLLDELERNGVSLLWLCKLTMICPGKKGNRYWFPKLKSYRLFNENKLIGEDYVLTDYYSEFTTLLFLSPAWEDVIKERITSNDLVSKSLEKWGLKQWLGL